MKKPLSILIFALSLSLLASVASAKGNGLTLSSVESRSISAYRAKFGIPKNKPVYASGCRLYAKGERGTCDSLQSSYGNATESLSKCTKSSCGIYNWYWFNPL